MSLLYLVALAIALTGMVMLDRRFRLFFWADARRAALVLLVGLAFFVAWDLAGIGLGVFFRGETAFMTGLQLAPELPLEEPFFLTVLCYLTMNLYGFFRRSGTPSSGSSTPSSGSSLSRSPAQSRQARSTKASGQ